MTRIESEMSVSKADMYGSYLALFCFASAMVLIQLYFDSNVGPVLWGLVALQIYRRDESALIVTLRSLFWLVIIGGIGGIVWLVLDSQNVNLNKFVDTEGLGLAISAALFWRMRSFIEQSSTAADIFSATIAAAQAPADDDIATVESLSPEPPAESIFTQVFARAKQVMSWRGRSPQPAFVGNPAATAGDVADHGGVTHTVTRASSGTDLGSSEVLQTATANRARIDGQPSTLASKVRLPVAAAEPAKAAQPAAWVATKTAAAAPPPLAAPKQVAGLPYIKAEPSGYSKTVSPEDRGTIPLQTVIDEERVYAQVADELETGGIDKGLWTRLFAECDGDERRTKVLYIRQRAARLIAAERARGGAM